MSDEQDKQDRPLSNPESKRTDSEPPKRPAAVDDDDRLELSSHEGAAAYEPFVSNDTTPESDEKTAPEAVEATDPFIPKAASPEKPAFKKLSDDQLQAINDRMNAQSGSIPTQARKETPPTTGRPNQPVSQPNPASGQRASIAPIAPISPSAPSAPSTTPQMQTSPTGVLSQGHSTAPTHSGAIPVSGVARFNGNTVTFSDSIRLREDDSISLGQKQYQLKPAPPDRSLITNAFVGAALLVAGYFAHGLLGGVSGGSLAGVALSSSGAPYGSGAVVRIPELGVSAITNEQGLFYFEDLPEGQHTVEFNLAGNLGGEAQALIREGSVTVLTLENATDLTRSTPAARSPKKLATTRKQPTKKQPVKSTVSSSSGGALAVTANASGGVVYIDGQELGPVNSTFRKMQSGSRSLRIEVPGYQPYETTVNITNGKLAKAHAELVKIQRESAQPAQLQASDYYDIAYRAVESGEYTEAASALDEALRLDPSMADAYFLRAEIKGSGQTALLDYLRAGEIYSSQRRDGDFRLALEKSIAADTDNKVAYKVRGDFNAQRGDVDQAINDYEYALEMDERYFDAHRALGVTLYKSGAHRNAQKHLLLARDLDQSDATLYHYLMLNSLAKNDLGGVKRYYVEFSDVASAPERKRFDSAPELDAVRRIVKR